MNKANYYQGIINSVQEPIVVIDRQMRIVDANEAARRAFGKNAADITGCPCHKVLHESDVPCHESVLRCPVREVFTTGKFARDIHRHQRADGRMVWEEILASPLGDENGEITLVVEELRDLTETLKHRNLIKELQDQVHTLEGLLPICCHCKKIRNADDQWEEVEHYVRKRADVDFTHGVCPDCMQKHYAEADA